MRKSIRPVTLLFLLALAAGCDKSVYKGGGASAPAASAPFLLIAVSPPDGAGDVEADAVVSAFFSRPPDPAACSSVTFRLVDETSGLEVPAILASAPPAADSGAACVTLTPRSPLVLPYHPYRFELSPCITAADGTSLDTARSTAPLTSRFTTGPIPDTDPPHFFFYAHRATAVSATAIALGWCTAIDGASGSPWRELRYAIYQGTTPESIAYDRPALLTLPGALQCVVGGLAPNTEYFFVIRPRDEAGNEDDNTVATSARTFLAADTTEITLLYTADVFANLEPCG